MTAEWAGVPVHSLAGLPTETRAALLRRLERECAEAAARNAEILNARAARAKLLALRASRERARQDTPMAILLRHQQIINETKPRRAS